MEDSKKVIFAGAAFIILAAAFLVIYLIFFQGGKPAAAEAEETILSLAEESTESVSAEETADMPEFVDVPLAESDDAVRELAGTLSSRPELTRWLLTEDLVRKFVAAVDNIASGESPRQHIDFLRITDKFAVLERDGDMVMDPAGFQRYNIISAVFSSLDSQGTAELYHRMTPVLQEAYSDLGYPGADFHDTLLRALDELLAVPAVEKDVILEEKLKSFALADPQLEELSQAQKHILRMGPRNVRSIQEKLRELKNLLQ
jgi:hypothetical protein